MTNQPEWECVANLGDADPITYGGLLVYIDKTGVYPPEVEVIQEEENEDYDSDYDQEFVEDEGEDEGRHYDEHLEYDEDNSEELHWTIYRAPLERCTYNPVTECLSDNPYHPDHSAWFSQTIKERAERPQDSGLESVCSSVGIARDELIKLLCSDDPIELAQGYRCIADTWGWHNFDNYPLTIKSRQEMEERYKDDLEHLKAIGRR
jgi:hypothetical protein